MLSTTIRKAAMTVAALGALALGGAAIAGAADEATPTQDRPQRDALTGDTAAKVKAAALEEVPGATVLRTEAGGPYDTPYHAHIETADGTRQVVLVNSSFEATAVEAERGRGQRGPYGPGGRDHPECDDPASGGDGSGDAETSASEA